MGIRTMEIRPDWHFCIASAVAVSRVPSCEKLLQVIKPLHNGDTLIRIAGHADTGCLY